MSYLEIVRRIQVDAARDRRRRYGTASLAEVAWPKNTFRSRQGAALAFGAMLERLRRDRIIETAEGGRTWRVNLNVQIAANPCGSERTGKPGKSSGGVRTIPDAGEPGPGTKRTTAAVAAGWNSPANGRPVVDAGPGNGDAGKLGEMREKPHEIRRGL